MDEKILAEVKDIQKDFIYEAFTAGDYTVYHCHKPGTIHYAFEIVLGKMGIYVGGDIGSLTFRVARGLEFLAGDDVDYYIHSKLEHDYYSKTELSKPRLKEYLKTTLLEALDDFDDFEDEIPEMKTLEEVVEFYEKEDLNFNSISVLGKPTRMNLAWELYEELINCEDLNEIYRIISDSHFYDGDPPGITAHDSSVQFRLYMVNHAAKKIMEKR